MVAKKFGFDRLQSWINFRQQPEDNFEQAASYVLEKNKDLYDRLA